MRHFLSATESTDDSTNDIFARAQQALPSCYTGDFDECLNADGKPQRFPNCDLILQAYDKDYDRMQAMVDQMKFCPAPDPTGDLIKLAIAAVVGAGIGFLIPHPKK